MGGGGVAYDGYDLSCIPIELKKHIPFSMIITLGYM